MNVHLVMMFFSTHFAIKPIKKSRYFVVSTSPDIGFKNKTSSREIAVIKEVFLPRTKGNIIEAGAPRAGPALVLLRCGVKTTFVYEYEYSFIIRIFF